MMDIIRTAALIAGEINVIKDQVRSTALNASVEIGKRLQEAKALVPAGEWTAWLQTNVDYSARTAQNLMALASEYGSGNARSIENLTYTKAVMLLSVPAEEREDFVQSHDVEGMSTRALKEELDRLKKKNDEMQITMDQLLAEKPDGSAEEMQRTIDDLRSELEKSRSAVEMAKDVGNTHMEKSRELRKQLREAEEKAQQEREAAEQEKKALEKALQDARQPVIQQVTPPDVEKELAALRAQVGRSQEEMSLRAMYELLKSTFERLRHHLAQLDQEDAALAGRFRQAFGKGLRLMADGLEDQEASA